MRGIVGVCAVVGAVCLSGCATAPMERDIQRTAIIDRPFDPVWQDLVAFFATNSIPIRNIEKDSGLIVAERQVTGLTAGAAFRGWADCGGAGFLESPVGRTVNLNVYARPSGAERTSVTVTTLFSEERAMDAIRTSVECASTGRLESLILNELGADLPAQPQSAGEAALVHRAD